MKIGIHNLQENGLYLRVQLREIYIYNFFETIYGVKCTTFLFSTCTYTFKHIVFIKSMEIVAAAPQDKLPAPARTFLHACLQISTLR
jgi:hypothetical protein